MQETASLIIKIDGREIAVGQKSLEDLADAGGRAEKATQGLSASSGQLTAAQRQLAAEARKAAGGLTEAANDALAMDRRVTALRQSYDPLAASIDRTNKELAEAADLYRLGAIAADEYATAQATLQTRLTMLGRAHAEGGKAARLQSYEMVNLGRQFGDVATMAALGASPMMILSTQGLQIAEIFGVARERGVGLGAALGQIGGAAGTLVARFLPVGAAIGAVVGAFALFERAVDKNTEQATTFGQTWQATTQVIGEAIMSGPIGSALQALGRMFGSAFDAITEITLSFLDQTVGKFGAAYQLVVQNWRRLPQVFGVLAQEAANAFITRIEAMVNTATAGINVLLERVGMAAISRTTLPRIRLANAELTAEFERLSESISASFREDRISFFDKIVARTDAIARAAMEAEDAVSGLGRSSKTAAEGTDEFDRALAELLGRLETPAERALRQMHADMRLLKEALDRGKVSLDQYREAMDRLWTPQPQLVRAITAEIITLSDEARSLPTAWEQALSAVEEVEAATRSIRWAVDDVARAIEDKDWGGVFAGLLRTLERVKELWNSGQPGGRYSAAGSLFSAAGSAVGGTGGMVLGAVGSGFSAAGSAAGLASMGGLGASIAGLAGPIGIAVAGFSLLSSVLSDDAAKKRAKAEAEARDMANARQIAEQQAAKQAELQIELLRAQGDEVGALAKERERELAALDRTSAALQRQIYALEDWRKTVTEAESAVASAEADLRSAYNTERDRLLAIIGGVDTARSALEQAYRRERSAIEATVSGVESLVQGFRAFRQELEANPLAGASQGRDAALAAFMAAAPSEMVGAGRSFLSASQASASTAQEFLRDRALIARSLEAAAANGEAQLTEAERQIALLDQQVAGLLAANDNLLSVEQAILNLQTAEQAAAEAQAQLLALDAQVGALINLNTSVLSVGQAIANLAQATSALAAAQVHGGMSMAIGYGMGEQLLFDPKTGRPLNNNLLDYKLCTMMDHPDLKAEFVENFEPTSPFGTKALGEPPTCPGAPAIRNAILNATGVAVNQTPMTPHILFERFKEEGLL